MFQRVIGGGAGGGTSGGQVGDRGTGVGVKGLGGKTIGRYIQKISDYYMVRDEMRKGWYLEERSHTHTYTHTHTCLHCSPFQQSEVQCLLGLLPQLLRVPWSL